MVAVLAIVAVALCVATAVGVGLVQRDRTLDVSHREQRSQLLLTALLAEQDGARGYFATGDATMLQSVREGKGEFSSAIAQVRRLSPHDAVLESDLAALAASAQRWQAQLDPLVTTRRVAGRAPTTTQETGDEREFSSVRTRYAVFTERLVIVNRSSLSAANWLAAGLVGALAVMLAALAVFVVRRGQLRERSRVLRLDRLRERMQHAASESDARHVLIGHVEGIAPGASVTVVPPAEAHRRTADDVICEPLPGGDGPLGAVVVASSRRLDAEQRRQLRESALQAAPILAARRTLELAERRATTDPLTGLPNRGAADVALYRMAAHAGRTLTPLAAVLVDLDHFKAVNDRHGHAQGDRVLTAIAGALADGVRASDFVARYGGEEFIVLLPDTDRGGAAELAEKLRHAVQSAPVGAIGPITASLGVAALPEDAVDPDAVVRMADGALYVAKSLGRNRVEQAEPSRASGG
jgi:diguanylate cyclase (GGDEF)-like protein